MSDLDLPSTPEQCVNAAYFDTPFLQKPDTTPLIFLWESYKTCLETIKSNQKLDVLYHDIAMKALNYTLVFKRKHEFRKLAEMLRQHLQNVTKYTKQVNGISLDDPETLARLVEIRFKQLEVTMFLEYHQEAFKSIEDIHGLLHSTKRVKPSSLALYYQKLGDLLKLDENSLFHACALLEEFKINNQNPNKSLEREERMASKCVMGYLSIPIDCERAMNIDQAYHSMKNARLSTLLNVTEPTRNSLLRQLVIETF